MSPEAAQRTVDEMKKIARRMRQLAGREDLHSGARYRAVMTAEHAEAVAAEHEEQLR